MKKIPYLHIGLFLLTVGSTLTVGAMQSGVDIIAEPVKIYKGIPFAASLMLILLFHEFSHYFTSRMHGVEATLPYFIPAPNIIGTFGAFIRMRSPIATRKSLIDIGASGPVAGFIVSVIASVIGLSMSTVISVRQIKPDIIFGDSLLFTFLSRIVLGATPAESDILLHPVAFAGWIGLFVTSMNLIPVGQLDGGHIAYALLGERHKQVSFLLVVLLAVFGIFLWEGWIIWAVVLLALGLRHPPVIFWETSLDRKRKFAGWLALVIFIITFIPVPFRIP